MFDSIIGHSRQKNIINNILKTDSISHAYLFFGKKGVGKALMAFEFARALLGVENLESSPDYVYVSKKEDKKDIIVEQIRDEIIDTIYEAPIAGKRKVYIIDDAQLLNIAAQNALLKTLEEPPRYVVIIIIANNKSAFLPTILSRVNEINFTGIGVNEMLEYISRKYAIKLSPDIVEYIGGSIGEANIVIENNYLDKFTNMDELLKCLKKKDLLGVYNLANNIDFSDIYIIDYFVFKLYKENMYSMLKFVERAKIRLKNNGNYDIVVDNMILSIMDNI